MAPEQLAGAPADARSDLYAFAVSLHEALFGARPFTGRTLAELLSAKRTETLTSTDSPAVPNAIRDTLKLGLRADPTLRPASMAEFLDALETAATPLAQPRRRDLRPWIAIAVAAGTAIVVARGARHRATSIATAPVVAMASASTSLSSAACRPSACAASHPGEAYTCRPSDGTCVPIASQDCTAAYEPGDLAHDDTLWLGAMFPLTGPNADAFGKMNARGVELARAEIAEATHAFDGPTATTRVRRVAIVTCDDAADPMRAAKHLVEDVGVPAIIGFGSGQKLIDIATAELIPHRVLTLASLSQNPYVTSIPQPAGLPRMLWRTTYSALAIAPAAAHLAIALARSRSEAQHVPKIAHIHDRSQPAMWFADLFPREFAKAAGDTADARAAYTEFTLPMEASAAQDATLAQAIAKTGAEVIIATGDTRQTVHIANLVDNAWPRSRARPAYLLQEGTTELFRDFVGRNDDRRRRVFAIGTPWNTAPNRAFVDRFNGQNTAHASYQFNPSPSYDSVYLATYAAFALGEAALDGASMSRALSRVVRRGDAAEVGPFQVFRILQTLGRGEDVALVGAAGSLALDEATGEAPVDLDLLCAAFDAGSDRIVDANAGLTFRAGSHSVLGTMRCR
jgi:hypothetical protein